MLGWLRRSTPPLGVAFDHDTIILRCGQGPLGAGGWKAVLMVDVYLEDGLAQWNFKFSGATLFIHEGMKGYERFIDECAERLSGWPRDWRSQVKSSTKTVVWEKY